MFEIVKASKDCPLYKTLIKMRKGDYIVLKPEDVQQLGETGMKQAILSAEDDRCYSFESRYRLDTLELWCV